MMETLDFKLAHSRKNNTFIHGNTRIAVITPKLLRIEYACDGKFEDRQSLAVINRDSGEVEFQFSQSPEQLIITTEDLTFNLSGDGMTPPDKENCSIDFKLNGLSRKWYPGAPNDGNLYGTARTLDECNGQWVVSGRSNGWRKMEKIRKLDLDNGFISRSGWNVIDDSMSAVYTLVDNKKWVDDRPKGERQDYYIFVYGHDYRKALKDAGEVFGSQPLPPRYTLGYWFSRYWSYTDTEFEEIIDNFDRYGIPIDVMVIDMDWHLEGWTGYTWDKRFFPDPDGFLQELHRRGCRVTLNLHPADGVGKHEAQFTAMAEAMGVDPQNCERIEMDMVDQKYVKNYFEILHHPEEKRGVDFWWMDWQQGMRTRLKGLDPLPWLNHLHWEDFQKQGKRPLIFSRYGGPGSGRYVIGFSGDTICSWESLAFQPYFTATAANVLYGYWSHDIGGHNPGPISPELYLRWVQYGCYSPVIRTHTGRNIQAERRFYAFAQPFANLMSEAICRRYELVPYIYSENRKAVETGVSLCHGIYYDYPDDDRAYNYPNEYFFGDSMIVNPVTIPVDKKDDFARVTTYLPEGEWFDASHGDLIDGNSEFTREYGYDEVPVFYHSGSIIPGCAEVKRLNQPCFQKFLVELYPGNEGEYLLTEDDGESADYLETFAVIRLSHKKTGNIREIEIAHIKGTYPGFLQRRQLECRIHSVIPPSMVTINGKKLNCYYTFESAVPSWRYDGTDFTLVIQGELELNPRTVISITYPEDNEHAPVSRKRWLLSRLRALAKINNTFKMDGATGAQERLAQELAHTGNRISRHPENFGEEMKNLTAKLPVLPVEIIKMISCKDLAEIEPMQSPAPRCRKMRALLRLINSGV